MIWFFIAGWIAGAAFMVLYANNWVRRHTKTIMFKEKEEEKSDD